MPYIGNSPANIGNYQIVDDISSTFNGVLTSFALTASSLAINPAKSGQLLVSINGVLQEPDDTGTEGFKVSGSNIVFSSAPATGSTFWAVWQGQAVDIGTPSDGVVGTAQMSSAELALTGGLSLGDNVKAKFGAGDDLQIYHDGTNSRIHDTGTGNLIIRGSHLSLQDSDGYDYITAVDDGTGGTIRLFNSTNERLKTTSTGIDVTGSVTIDSGGTISAVSTTDLQINATDDLFLRAVDNIYIQPKGNDNGITLIGNGAVTLHHASSPKLATTTTGIDVTGDIKSSKLKSSRDSNNVFVDFVDSNAANDTNGDVVVQGYYPIVFKTDLAHERLRIERTGDTVFYKDTGSEGMRWDASAQRLGIGTNSPYAKMHNTSHYITDVAGTGNTDSASNSMPAGFGFKVAAGTVLGALINSTASSNWGADINFNVRSGGGGNFPSTPAMTVKSGGNVGIGTSSPIAPLHVAGNVVIETGSPDLYFAPSSASHANWRLAAQESTSNAFVISSGTHSSGSNAVADTYTPRFVVRDSGNMEIRAYNGSSSSPSEAADWPTPALSIRTYDGYFRNSVMSFGYAGDSVYQTGNNVWNFRLHDSNNAYSVSSSSSSTNLELAGPGNLTLGGIVTMPNQPAFNAHNAASTQTTGTIVWASTRSNIGNHYSTSTGNFTAPVAGTYSFSWQCYQNYNAVYSSITAHKNGSEVYEGLIDGSSNSYNSIDGAITIYLSVNDTFRLDVRQGTIHTNPTYSFFSGHLIG